MQVENGHLGESRLTRFRAVMVRVHHKSYVPGRAESSRDVLELYFLTQRSPRCVFQEKCIDEAYKWGWQGFSCLRCPYKNDPDFMTRPENLKGKIIL